MSSLRPTRTARAFAYFIDGGVVLSASMQVFAVLLFLVRMPSEDDPTVNDLVLSQQSRWLLVLGVTFAVLELAQSKAFMWSAPSFGFAVTGLDTEGERQRPALRRVFGVVLPTLSFFVLAKLLVTSETTLETPTMLLAGLVIAGVVFGAASAFALLDALIVLKDPAMRTLGDRLAGTRVVACAPTSDVTRRALHVAAVLELALAVAMVVSIFELAYLEGRIQMHVFATPARLVGYIVAISTPAALAVLYSATYARLGMPRLPMLAVAFLISIPLLSFFLAKRYVRVLSEALALPHQDALALRTLVDFAFVGQSVAGMLAIASTLTAIDAQMRVAVGDYPRPILDANGARLAVIAGCFCAVGLGFVLRKLSQLDYEALIPASREDLAEVFR